MARRAHADDRFGHAIFVDEIGIEVGGYGIYRMRTLFQRMFARRADTLHAVAVQGIVSPYVAGEAAPASVFEAAVAPDDMDFIGRMELALPVRNHCNLGADTLELVLGPLAAERDPEALVDRIRLIVSEVAAADLDPGQVICAIKEPAHIGPEEFSRLARELRRGGLRVAVGDFGAGHWTDGKMDMLEPELVRMDGDWFQKVCRDATTIRLFESVVARLRERKTKVLVEGIEAERHLAVALRANVDLFQGGHLMPPALVGTVVDETPISIAAKLGDSRKIVPLFG